MRSMRGQPAISPTSPRMPRRVLGHKTRRVRHARACGSRCACQPSSPATHGVAVSRWCLWLRMSGSRAVATPRSRTPHGHGGGIAYLNVNACRIPGLLRAAASELPGACVRYLHRVRELFRDKARGEATMVSRRRYTGHAPLNAISQPAVWDSSLHALPPLRGMSSQAKVRDGAESV
jgi:hypothetical protein